MIPTQTHTWQILEMPQRDVESQSKPCARVNGAAHFCACKAGKAKIDEMDLGA